MVLQASAGLVHAVDRQVVRAAFRMMTADLKHRALRALGHAAPFKGKDRILRLFAHPDRQPSTAFETPFFGRVYPGDLSSFLDWTVYFYGAYSPEELSLLSDLAGTLRRQRGSVAFYDIGANVGHHSLYMADHADTVHAFEPFEPVRQKIHEKITRNELTNIAVYPVALSDEDGTAMFAPPQTGNHGTGSLAHGARTLPVECRRGDGYLADLPRMDLIKMDVEGHEAAVLRGLRDRLAADRPIIITEISGDDRSGFGSETAFHAALYPDHLAFSLSPRRGGYALRPLRFGSAHEVLIVPAEETELLERLGVATR